MTSSAGWRGEKAQGGGKGSGTATSGGLRGIGGQLASTMCPLSAHHPCLSLCQIPKICFSLYMTLQMSMRIVAGSVCMVFSRYVIAEYFSSQFARRALHVRYPARSLPVSVKRFQGKPGAEMSVHNAMDTCKSGRCARYDATHVVIRH